MGLSINKFFLFQFKIPFDSIFFEYQIRNAPITITIIGIIMRQELLQKQQMQKHW